MNRGTGTGRRPADAGASSAVPTSRATLGVAAALMSIAAGCGSDDQLQRDDLSGSYTASRWVFVDDTSASNVIAAGGRLELTLDPDGSTAVEAVLPPDFTRSDTTLEESLAGRWKLRNDTVWLSELDGRVFLDGAPLVARRVPLSLRGEYPSVIVTLTPDEAGSR